MKFTHAEFVQFYNDREEKFDRERSNIVICSNNRCTKLCSIGEKRYRLRSLINFLQSNSGGCESFGNIILEEGIFSIIYLCEDMSESPLGGRVKLTCKLNIQEHNQLSLF
uniref:Uncharacterized protein n=1 Tax=viral metagenome TaxID=1070528 RepID=A0A6H1ZZ46_9ZZZZ